MNSKILRKSRSLSELGRLSPTHNTFFFSVDNDDIKELNDLKRKNNCKSPMCFLPQIIFEKSPKKNTDKKNIGHDKISSIAINEFMNMMIDNG